ncbi:MMPL family transporter [Bacillus sp. 179-C3.3 HS]|uniref:MMPL family transporter n=1 Tax=Bacillus sp. 179-C3.3 HS TaxID=3232162 RepID=UPI0039A15371
MLQIIKARWMILVVWMITAVVLFFTAPDLEDLTREKGQLKVPEGTPTSEALHLLDKLSGKDGKKDTGVIVFSEPQLFPKKEKELKKALTTLIKHAPELHIDGITSYFHEDPDIQNQLLSKDKSTLLVPFKFDHYETKAMKVKDQIEEVLKPYNVSFQMTGQKFVDSDVIKSSQEGLKKTELITIIFIFFILIIVFRSILAPVVPLITIGISYAVSRSIVAFLVEYTQFPLSNFTQIFMVAIMFGIGTDYCILLLSRFKEEIGQGRDVQESIIVTYKCAGKTVFFSGLAVLVGFSSIGFAKFQLYQSAVSVAVGVGILLIALVTIVPFFMSVFGKSLFWPSKRENIHHPQSKMWEMAGRFSFKRPLISLGVVAFITVPPIIMYDGNLSYNSLNEIGTKYESVSAFNKISEQFGFGEALPLNVLVESDNALDNQKNIVMIEKLTRKLSDIDEVKAVRSVTRPVGDGLSQLYVTSQAKELGGELGKGHEGIGQISDGLSEANLELLKQKPKIQNSAKGIDQLIHGTKAIKSGVGEVRESLIALEDGVKRSKDGVGTIRTKIKEAKKNLEQEYQSSQAMITDLEAMVKKFKGHAKSNQQLITTIKKVKKSYEDISFEALEKRMPEIKDMDEYQDIKKVFKDSKEIVDQATKQLDTYEEEASAFNEKIKKADEVIQTMSSKQEDVKRQVQALMTGLDQIYDGLEQTNKGQKQLIKEMPKIEDGADQLANGQKTLKEGFNQLSSKLNVLTDGLDESITGLEQVKSGFTEADDYLKQLQQAPDEEITGWFIPEEVLKRSEFKRIFNTYMSPDRKLTTFEVILNVNPYSNEAMKGVAKIEDTLDQYLPVSGLKNANYGVSGISSLNVDLKETSDGDFIRTVIFMLIGIFFILIILLRSIVMPIYLTLSLILTYFTSIGLTEWIFKTIFGYDGVSWAVPFFSFVILVTLGIDYSIFLMDRFNEWKGEHVQASMISAMRNMGSVIISAVAILAGTFAAMLPSGVLSLVQIATVVLIGLLLYAYVVLPLFIPVMVRIFGKWNWWPFKIK